MSVSAWKHLDREEILGNQRVRNKLLILLAPDTIGYSTGTFALSTRRRHGPMRTSDGTISPFPEVNVSAGGWRYVPQNREKKKKKTSFGGTPISKSCRVYIFGLFVCYFIVCSLTQAGRYPPGLRCRDFRLRMLERRLASPRIDQCEIRTPATSSVACLFSCDARVTYHSPPPRFTQCCLLT